MAELAVNVPTASRTVETLYYRHTLPVRLMHWINVLALTVLLMSGLNIFNAHPSLNWGKSSYTGTPAVLEIGAIEDASGKSIGVITVCMRISGGSPTTM